MNKWRDARWHGGASDPILLIEILLFLRPGLALDVDRVENESILKRLGLLVIGRVLRSQAGVDIAQRAGDGSNVASPAHLDEDDDRVHNDVVRLGDARNLDQHRADGHDTGQRDDPREHNLLDRRIVQATPGANTRARNCGCSRLRGGHGDGESRCSLDGRNGARVGCESRRTCDEGDVHADGLDDGPAAQQCASCNGALRGEDNPRGWGQLGAAGRLQVAAGVEGGSHDAHRLLGIVLAVRPGKPTRSADLKHAEDSVVLGDALGPAQTEHVLENKHDNEGDGERDGRGRKDANDDVGDRRVVDHAGATDAQACADEAANNGVGGGAGNAEAPCDKIPEDCAEQRAEGHADARGEGVGHGRQLVELDRAGDGVGDGGNADKRRKKVEDGGQNDCLNRGERLAGNGGGDRVSRVVEAIREVEHERQRDGDDGASQQECLIRVLGCGRRGGVPGCGCAAHGDVLGSGAGQQGEHDAGAQRHLARARSR
eukprot:m.20758 g.20758  ORF g.20758 m.20758 type:complete len:487 (-) comp3560_c0_seq1:48-1508(-)